MINPLGVLLALRAYLGWAPYMHSQEAKRHTYGRHATRQHEKTQRRMRKASQRRNRG